ncbi:MAG: hypothetical protein KIS78_01990 [Labilithrix sp.]|nr:hypothetical protein [Labilithrix sp.]MCW5831211.1 hypothetical protein [Labilithrix sp.]
MNAKKLSWLLLTASVVFTSWMGCSSERVDVGTRLSPTPEEDPPFSASEDAASPALAMCPTSECPSDRTTCPGNPFPCSVDLSSDGLNCGACGNECPGATVFGVLRMGTRCVGGTCQRECVSTGGADYRDCNGVVDDGCEVDILSDVDHCGACGNKCPEGTAVCIEGQCGCPAGMTHCGCAGGSIGGCANSGCTDTKVDDNNCGACGTRCRPPTDAGPPPPNTVYGCGGGECGKLRCQPGWADCDGDVASNGCEVRIVDDPEHCGGCGIKCGAGQICLTAPGGTPACVCDPSETLCPTSVDGDGKVVNGYCADLLIDQENCGVCGHACPGPTGPEYHGFPRCTKSYCEYGCEAGYADCDQDLSNGCETKIDSDPNSCGACGHRCDADAGQPCVNGACRTVECDAGPVTQ